MKLLRKLLLRVLLMVFIAGGVIGGISVAKSYDATQELTFKNMEQTIKLNAAVINEKLESTVRMIEIIGADTDVVKALTYNKATTGVIESFTNVVENNGDLIGMIALIDRNGIIFTSDSINALENVDVSEREYLRDAKSGHETVISEIVTSKVDGSQVVVICEPIYNGDLYVGAILATIKFNLVTDLLDDIKVGENGYAYLIDIRGEDAGLTVDHPNPDHINELNLYNLKNDALTALADDMKAETYGQGTYVYDGVEKFVEFHQIAGNWALAVTANADELDKTSNEIILVTLIVLVIMIFVTTGLGYLVVSILIVNPIKKLQASMALAGSGDLTHPVYLKRKDEIKMLADDYNIMLENQKKMISEINDISMDMSASAEELTASAEEVNESANEVSTNIQDMMTNIMAEHEEMATVSKEVEDLNRSIDQSDTMIQQSKQACDASLEIATHGREGVKSSVQSIENISASTRAVLQAFKELTEHAQKVTGISEIISSIADQINLLALNASIEAARAGDAGRGFTVVAEEVRKLAEQTSNESDNISSVLGMIIKLVNEANHSVDNTKMHVDQGEETIHSLDGKFMEIIDAFNQLDEYIGHLTDISSRQVKISNEIQASVDEITGSADRNASMAQEISAAAEEQTAITDGLSQASEETSNMADQMNGLIEKFTI